jgi:AraC-like DNA-binding protein
MLYGELWTLASMQLLTRINKWFSRYKKKFFIYKDGFFELSYLTNSPEAIIQSLDKMPFVKHKVSDKCISSNTPFMKAVIHYLEVEDGLWLLYADAHYKVNVYSNRITDKTLPANYYKLSLGDTTQEVAKAKPALVNGIPYSRRSWLLFKPATSFSNCHFKGMKETSLTVFFSDKWLQETLYKNTAFTNSSLKNFFESDANYIMWPDSAQLTDEFYKPLIDALINNRWNEKDHLPEIKKQVAFFLNYFIGKYNRDKINENFFEISDSARKNVLKAERILIENLNSSFVGIEDLAKKVGISPTKLKTDFKLMFGESIFQYFRQKQMDYAHSLIKNSTQSIKDVADLLGYENASKFSAAFKNHFGVLPSEVMATSKSE